ncbi:uncharacterized protein LOC129728522 [Wyeomyia smithii]|uniref:uncharacterized protein LOC129728522 n=1 Tax=Wyeomyia smithii TaxID=174621 RepID=UPI00246806C1|nr:uncharacterized protein LOC129728522 [Wyeomyia smithii]
MPDNNSAKMLSVSNPAGRRRRGAQRARWLNQVKQDLGSVKLSRNWRQACDAGGILNDVLPGRTTNRVPSPYNRYDSRHPKVFRSQRTPVQPRKSDESDIFRGFPDDEVQHTVKMNQPAAADKQTTKQLSLSRQRDQVMSKLVRIYNAVKDIELGLPLLKFEAKKLEAVYAEFSGFHSQIIAIIPEEQIAAQEAAYVRFEKLYDWTSAQVESLIIKQENTKPSQVILQQQPLKAPIPVFDGDYTNWPKFKAIFMDVMAQSRDSDAVKLYHLDKALTGAAAGILDAKVINEGNYELAWKILTERFENTRVIVETHIQGLLSFKRMTSESSKELRNLLDVCTKNVQSLEYLCQQLIGVSELIVVYLLTAAFDKSTRKHWEQSFKPGELPTYKETVEFMKSHCQVLERCETANQIPTTKVTSALKQSSPTSKFIVNRAHAATSSETSPSEKCDFCSGTHLNYQCNKFGTISSKEKMEKIRAAGICFNCLRKGHQSRNCPSLKSCRKCQKRHHTQLHEDSVASKHEISPSPITASVPKEEPPQLATSVPMPTKSSEPPVLTAYTGSRNRVSQMVLLQTALVNVIDKEQQLHPCRILLDSGFQVNFITERMANILNIERQPINVPIAGINNLRMTAREKVIIEFQSRCSDFRAKLECLNTTKMTGVISSKNIDVANLNIPKGVQLADPTFFRPSNIDMLIGAAMFFDLIKADYITIGANLPVLRDSHLGWLVAGTIQSDTTADDCQYSQVASIQTLNDPMQKFWQF